MRRDLALGLQLRGQMADDVVVFGVHHHQRAGAARDGHDFQDFLVGQREALIGHEHLERGIAVADRRRQFLAEHGRRWIGNDQVKAVIRVTLAVRLGVIVLDRLAQPLPALLQAERDDRRVAAKRGGAGAAFEIVGLHDIGTARLRDVHVTVDAAGQHQAVGGVNNGLGVAKVEAEARDPPILDADIAAHDVGACGDGAALNDQIERGHGLVFLCPTRLACKRRTTSYHSATGMPAGVTAARIASGERHRRGGTLPPGKRDDRHDEASIKPAGHADRHRRGIGHWHGVAAHRPRGGTQPDRRAGVRGGDSRSAHDDGGDLSHVRVSRVRHAVRDGHQGCDPSADGGWFPDLGGQAGVGFHAAAGPGVSRWRAGHGGGLRRLAAALDAAGQSRAHAGRRDGDDGGEGRRALHPLR